MTTFWLIRHGDTDYVGAAIAGRMPGVHLNETGRHQAQELPRQFANVSLSAVYSSPLERAIETAEPLARAKNLSIVPSEGATELEFGEWTGKSFAELDPLPEWRKFNTQRSITPIPGGEMMLEVQTRIVKTMRCMRRRHPDRHVAIVSHGDVIKSAIAHFMGIPLDLFHRFEVGPASISVIGLDDHGPQVLRVNQQAAL